MRLNKCPICKSKNVLVGNSFNPGYTLAGFSPFITGTWLYCFNCDDITFKQGLVDYEQAYKEINEYKEKEKQ